MSVKINSGIVSILLHYALRSVLKTRTTHIFSLNQRQKIQSIVTWSLAFFCPSGRLHIITFFNFYQLLMALLALLIGRSKTILKYIFLHENKNLYFTSITPFLSDKAMFNSYLYFQISMIIVTLILAKTMQLVSMALMTIRVIVRLATMARTVPKVS